LALCVWAVLPAQLSAQNSAPAQGARAYFQAFASKRLIPVETAEVRELREQLARAEQLLSEGAASEAALLLTELTEHPRFADYAELQEMSAAYYALGTAHWKLGAAGSGQQALRVILAHGAEDAYFAPAFRRYVDIALAERQLAPALAQLSAYQPSAGQLPQDARDELSYLQARERMQASDSEGAMHAFDRVSNQSRFFANAQFELGGIAAQGRAYREAETHFCRAANMRDDSPKALLHDARYYPVKDLARLGLARIAHEQLRGRAAFDHDFQIPADSPRLPEALFEAAYARYEANDPDTALDLLDQLQARFPRSVHADEAALLRGYIALARCDFKQAEEHFTRFEAQFTPVVQLTGRILKNPSRRETLYEALRDRATDSESSRAYHSLLGLLRSDPAFEELHQRVEQLDRQAASAERMPESFALLRARYESGDKPLPAQPVQAEGSPDSAQAIEELKLSVDDARVGLRALTEQLDMLRAAGAPASDLAEQERVVAALAGRQHELRVALDNARAARSSQPESADGHAAKSGDVVELLRFDESRARGFERRAGSLRQQLVRAANELALRELQALHDRLSGFVRRARIGHIDAAMGAKRRIEREIESLAAGRFPPELRARKHAHAYLADDEEYWPFEGEDWEDEDAQDAASQPQAVQP
jgi:TolA-binding protein